MLAGPLLCPMPESDSSEHFLKTLLLHEPEYADKIYPKVYPCMSLLLMNDTAQLHIASMAQQGAAAIALQSDTCRRST